MDIFLFIASQLLNSIWNLATSYGSKTKIENLELLITKRLEYMNLYVSHENEMESLQTIVQLLSTAALRQAVWHLKKYIPFKFYNIFFLFQPLKTLRLWRCKIPHHSFQGFLPAFPNLLKLDFTHGSARYPSLDHELRRVVDDQLLFLIGTHCKNLE